MSAHDAGVVHRDLKPANIMIGADDEPTIMDFGIARSSSRSGQERSAAGGIKAANVIADLLVGGTMAGAIIGTVEYMAPEQAKGLPVDQRADIYAFGLILYDMLIGGRRSSRAESAIAELQARMEKAPPAPRSVNPEIPPAIDAIVCRCLEPDADKRFQDDRGAPSGAGPARPARQAAADHPAADATAMAGIAALMVLLLGGTFYATKWLSAPTRTPDPVSVVIADVRNDTGDAAFDDSIRQTLKRALEDASFISAYDRSGMSALGVGRRKSSTRPRA